MKKNCLIVLFIVILRVSEGVPLPLVIPAHGINSRLDDPNGERASRLLFSPSASRITSSKDIPAVFLRVRDYHTGADAESEKVSRSVASTDSAIQTPSQNNVVKDRPATRETCHSAALHKCGLVVIHEFSSPTKLTPEHKCRIRENFLHCMLKPRKTSCRTENRGKFISEEMVRSLRQKLIELLWTARGCVIGLDAF